MKANESRPAQALQHIKVLERALQSMQEKCQRSDQVRLNTVELGSDVLCRC